VDRRQDEMGRTGFSAAGDLLDALVEQVGDTWRGAESRRIRLGRQARGHASLPDLLELLHGLEQVRPPSAHRRGSRGPRWSLLLGLAAAVCAALAITQLRAERAGEPARRG